MYFLRNIAIILIVLLAPCFAAENAKHHVLLLTADDLNYNSLGFAGNPLPGITPHLDRLAKQSLWLEQAHVTVAVCQPSRQCLLTGRYPHRNGSTGFYPVSDGVPTLAEILKSAGYEIGILGKAIHLRPESKFPWHFIRDEEVLGRGRNPQKYYEYSKEFFMQAKTAGRPFFLMANSHDPHRPFAGSEGKQPSNYPAPKRSFTPEEISVPGFLPDLPPVRTELAQYFSSVNRCDETMGEVLRALDESGLANDTIVIFLSDNGISMPFAKSNCYLTSTRTPWLVRWPGTIAPNTVDREHLISGIDFMPTILEALSLPIPAGTDGQSFLPILRGQKQVGREKVFTCYNEASGSKPYPMRCVQSKRFGYIYNHWSNGKKLYGTEGMSGLTFQSMQKAGVKDQDIADRVELLVHRVPEELYDFAADPNALHNLIDDPKFSVQRQLMRAELLSWMEKTSDPLLEKFRQRCCVVSTGPTKEVFLAQGLMAGEVAADSVLVQTRLTAVPELKNGKGPGIAGVGRFEYATSAEFHDSQVTDWLDAREESDFILRGSLEGLQPSTRYYYRVIYGADQKEVKTSAVAQFRTLPAPKQMASLNFVITSCLNYAFFQEKGKISAKERRLGYPALVAIDKLNPDFLLINGDCVYYDHPYDTRAKKQTEMRDKWHEQYAMPRFVNLFGKTPVYWSKDDHDYRRNDSDTTGDYAPSHESGIATFREQVPVARTGQPTYRTHRMGRDLQLWWVEGRDFRSPNQMPDGPQKSIWGAEQKAWLKRSLLESDATFKILISPTPMIGPDDASKNDNHANAGFRHEGDAFFAWMKENGISPARFFIVCGDRHWKYHSRNAQGYQEFSCGALNIENARLGRAPGSKGSSDPQGRIVQSYTDAKPTGGFLHIRLTSGEGNPTQLHFRHCDDSGKELYQQGFSDKR